MIIKYRCLNRAISHDVTSAILLFQTKPCSNDKNKFFTKKKQDETMVNFNFLQPRKRHIENCYIISKVC